MPQNTLSYYCSLCVDQPISAVQLIAGNQRKDQLQSYTFFLNRCLLSRRNCANLPARMAQSSSKNGAIAGILRMVRVLAPDGMSLYVG